MTSKGKAHLVCGNCRAKKKACDKKLPTCSYCAKRELRCFYQTNTDDQLRPFVVFSTKSQHSQITSLTSSTSLTSLSPGGNQQPLSVTVQSHVTRLLQEFDTSFQSVSDKYLRGLNQWLPVICPSTFLEMQSKYIILPTDQSRRCLAVCLLVARPPIPPSREQSSSITEPLYVFVKMLFAQIQAEEPASIAMAQAGVLLAAYEYACARPDAAYISLNTCVGMAQTLSLDINIEGSDTAPRHKTRERSNLWWGIVILQRYCPKVRQRVSFKH